MTVECYKLCRTAASTRHGRPHFKSQSYEHREMQGKIFETPRRNRVVMLSGNQLATDVFDF